MNLQLIAITLSFISLFITLYILIKKRRQIFGKLFGANEGYLSRNPGDQDKIIIYDFDEVIKNTKELANIFISDKRHEELYKKILSDDNLRAKLKKSPSGESKKIIEDWIKQNYSSPKQQQINSQQAVKNQSPLKKEGKKDPSAISNPNKDNFPKNQPSQNPQTPQNTPTPQNLSAEEESKVKETYYKIEEVFQNDNIEKITDIIKKISDDEVKMLMKNYDKISLGEHKIAAIEQVVKKSQTKEDVVRLMLQRVINHLKEKHDELKQKISSLRRKGIDTKSEELQTMSIPSKIKIFSATLKREDFQKARELINSIDNSLENKKEQNLKNDEKKEKSPEQNPNSQPS